MVKWLANQISNPVVQDPFLGGENMNLHLTPVFNQANKEARWVQDFLVWPQGWIESSNLLRVVENRECALKVSYGGVWKLFIDNPLNP